MEYEEERVTRLNESIGDSVNKDFRERFGPGSFGAHELPDRAYLVLSNWEDFIVYHDSTLLDPELFDKAKAIKSPMAEFYQFVGARETDTGESASRRSR